jgi:polyhydroxybutyrate depolymerase
VLLAAALALLMAACGDGSGTMTTTTPAPEPGVTAASTEVPAAARTSSGCTPARPHEPGRFPETLTAAGLEREYILQVPASYKGDDDTPLVVNLHGFGSNAAEQAAYSGLPAKAEEAGFIVVSPQGTGDQPHWNFTTVEPGAPDDVAFIDGLLNTLSSELCIDAARVYATGISNGAAMSVTLACRLSDRIAAIAPVAGVFFFPGCPSTRPVSVIAFHGTDDKLVPFEGGQIGSGSGLRAQPIEKSVESWAEHDGCDTGPEDEQVSEHVRLLRYESCDEGAAVELYVVEGGGHTWPGAAFDIPFGLTTQEISATDLLWAFFEAHPMP